MRIVIAEDDPLLREGLALLLRAESLDVVATTDSPDAFLAAVDAWWPPQAGPSSWPRTFRKAPWTLTTAT